MRFTKMQGLGNDYVYVNCLEERIEDPSALARRVSDRHFGVGSDGLILICPSEAADFRMVMYNADGTQAQMCGNGIRCVAKYVYDRGLTDKTRLSIETGAGVKTLSLSVSGGSVKTVTVDMGEPVLKPREIPVDADGDSFVARPVSVGGREWSVTCVSMGNPHAIVYVDDVDGLDLERIGPAFENHPLFPERVNAGFVQVLGAGELKLRTWERGAGETMACGTNATASLVASVLCEKTGREAVLHLRGGDLTIKWDEKSNHVFMTGPAEFVFDGEYFDESVKKEY